ncbi:MAG: c-type cytochrome [Planctomycetes bacterium]|nr:c-type cytochrome [Planctomycetota bacterium]
MDLYLTDSSPHLEKEMGCTVCHDGQGSGTSFPWTSHTPNDSEQQAKWAGEFGWFDNHHWIFPMKPNRFVESNCLKCHHEKGSLVASERFPDPPAPKLVEGWSLVEKFGCFGCHEVNGFDGPDRRVGPDVRLEPNRSEVAAQVLQDDGLSEEQRLWAEALVATPSNDAVRRQLFTTLKQDAAADEATLTAATHKLADGLKNVDAPGKYRKAGPSLRFLDSKVDFDWLHSWISQPADFRPSTRMPQFFGLHEHLQDPEDSDELAESVRYEPVEIRAMAEFLLANSNDFDYLQPPAEVTETASAERGKWLFESRGCLACHSHEGFAGIAADQGPDLSRVSAKFQSEKGTKWLYSWIKQPHRYHVRTKMPNLFLDPIAEKDATGKPTGKITDPAADIREFLLSGATDWKPASVERNWSPAELEALEDLAQEWITSDAIPAASAAKFVQEGFPDHMGSKLKSDEKILLGMTSENHVAKLQEYVARRSISKHGCFGCHDIPGFEGAKPIGTTLAEWGRKETSKLAFENIHKFLEGPGNPASGSHDGHGVHGKDDEHVSHGHLDPADFDPDTSYYIQSLNSHSRDGFIWQKLRMPRSFDYKTMKNKGYNERLRMPKFPLTDDQREAIITFVLGLVNEPPAQKLIYDPDPRQKAIVEGRQVLEKFNCAGCHTMRMEQWDLAFEEGTFDSQSEVVDFPFLAKHFSDPEIAASLKKDSRGMFSATLRGMPVLNEETGQADRVDEDGLLLEPDDDESDPYYLFTLWGDSVLEGNPWLQGVQDLMVPANPEGYGPAEGTAHPGWGGTLARYLYPRAIAKAKEANPQVKGSEAWGWLPPPLMDEGNKVQTDWLHGFLMDPTAIRPAALMRMPDFRMSSDDAAKLVDYFAAVSGAEFPYEYKSRQRASYLAKFEADRLSNAMDIVVNSNYCVKCHAVGDFVPQGDPATFGPNLAEVYRRLRPEYIRDWVANPKRTLPYTGMPVNIPFAGGISQDVFHGTSVEQLDGLIDLLMNYDVYTRQQTSVSPLVEAAAPAAGGAEENASSNEEGK